MTREDAIELYAKALDAKGKLSDARLLRLYGPEWGDEEATIECILSAYEAGKNERQTD